LRVFSSVPGQAEVLSGGDATGRWLRRGAGFISVNTSVVSCPIVASGSSASDLAGQIWGGSSSIYFAVVLRWQELRRVEELGAGISDNKAAVSSLALPHPSCGGGELGFFFLVELQRLKLAGREVLGCLINKLDELSSGRVVAVELSILGASLCRIVVVTIGERKWPGLRLHTGILLQIVDQYVVALVCCHIFIPSGIIWSTPTAALHRRDAVRLLYQMVVRRLLRALELALCLLHLLFSLQADEPKWRVFFCSAAAFHAGPSPSGVVPGDGAGGRGIEFDLIDGGEGSDGFLLYLCRVLFINFEDCVLPTLYLEVLFVKCIPTAL
jgi:hypothetical protein